MASAFGGILSAARSRVALGITAGTLLGVASAPSVAFASGTEIHAPHYPWTNAGMLSSFDHSSLRRGFEVYRQICSTCHSLKLVAYRNLVGVTHTEKQAKMIAATKTFMDGPNAEGEMFERPGKLTDKIPNPYPNEETARLANNGALPPDLSLMTKARHSGEDYVFSLLTGYRPAPEGVVVRQGMYYNPYFGGAAIGMTPPLSDGQIDYEDGTPATVSQMAKDVTHFLSWCSEPETDDRKRMGLKWLSAIAIGFCFMGYWKRFRWSLVKTRQISWLR